LDCVAELRVIHAIGPLAIVPLVAAPLPRVTIPDVLTVSSPAALLMLPTLILMVSALLRFGGEPGFVDATTGAPLMVWGLAYAEAGRLLILAMLFPLICNFGHAATILKHHLIGLTALGKFGYGFAGVHFSLMLVNHAANHFLVLG